MGEVEPENIDAIIEEFFDHFWRSACRADGSDDFRFFVIVFHGSCFRFL
jgi:hypothetical protein